VVTSAEVCSLTLNKIDNSILRNTSAKPKVWVWGRIYLQPPGIVSIPIYGFAIDRIDVAK
jgi:hypothetical protein